MINIVIASTYSIQTSTDRYSAHSIVCAHSSSINPMTTVWVEMKFTFIEIVNNNKMTMIFIHNCITSQCGCKS